MTCGGRTGSGWRGAGNEGNINQAGRKWLDRAIVGTGTARRGFRFFSFHSLSSNRFNSRYETASCAQWPDQGAGKSSPKAPVL